MPFIQMIYSSRPVDFSAALLDDILASARRNNRNEQITGSLICRSDLYVQMLEGPRFAVTSTFGRILDDARHTEVAILYSHTIEKRMFEGWDMRDDPPRDWMWSMAAIQAGVTAHVTAQEVLAVFERLADEIRVH